MAGIDTYTKLMLHCDGADASTTFTDSETTPKTVTAAGNAQIDTAQSKFGGASGLFDGTGDYLTVPASSDWAFGTGDFTIDFWVRFSGATAFCGLVDAGAGISGGSGFGIGVNVTTLNLYYAGAGHNLAWTASIDTWYHVAVTRNGTNLKAFIDGTQIGSTLTSSDDISDVTNPLVVANYNAGGSYLLGWMDELRVSKGIARWTTTFTPPAEAYSAPSNFISRLMLLGCG